ncbi:hypothetical protein RM844_09505 [Streptomyces sp. DSM 44915]|uniref:Tetratricopeptide repeat protein n=1 Tax=Streptomyces chisholmiae TaxID=3075540 RepID=A0ABU2JNF8_9ACTN|nr:hypothetical protein [Streptomyces sp. DSM 44915]MDT0266531.1 hypothetical protein [Streptomyces sp. DSM 44915]
MNEGADARPADDEPLGLRPDRPASPRWHRWRDLHNEGTELLQAGRPDAGGERLAAALAETLVPDVDAEGRLHRAATLTNLAGLAEGLGQLDASERRYTEAIALCETLTTELARPATGPAAGDAPAPAGAPGSQPPPAGTPDPARPTPDDGGTAGPPATTPQATIGDAPDPARPGHWPAPAPAADGPDAPVRPALAQAPHAGIPDLARPEAGEGPARPAANGLDAAGPPATTAQATAGDAPDPAKPEPAPAPAVSDVGQSLANARVGRAQTRMLAGDTAGAEADVAAAFAVAGGLAEPPDLLVFSLHCARSGVLMMTGRLPEAEQDALRALDLALDVRPELAPIPCEHLAQMAEVCGNPEGAAEFRRIAERPAEFSTMWSNEIGFEVADPLPGPEFGSTTRPRAMTWPLAARWRRVAALSAEGVRLSLAGGGEEAAALFEAAESATETLGGGLDVLVCRASVRLNHAELARTRGALGEALRLAEAAIGPLAEVVAAVGDRHGVAAQLLDARNLRAALLRECGRHDDALAELDRAERDLPLVGEGRQPAAVWIWLVRATVFDQLGRLGEGEAAGERALALAQEHAPWLAPRVHLILADHASTLGDEATSRERMALAGELFAVLGDPVGEAATRISLGRSDYLASRQDAAAAHYAVADQLLAGVENAGLRAACRHGQAAVAAFDGRPAEALTLLDEASRLLGPEHTPVQRVAFHQIRAGALGALDRFAEAVEELTRAREVAEASCGWHVTLTLDWCQADLYGRWAGALAEAERGPALTRAIEVAVPAALAAEAARQFFPAGGARERWVALAAAPSVRAAMAAVRNARDDRLAAALIDHLAATASLRTSAPGPAGGPAAPPDVLDLPTPGPAPLAGDGGPSYVATALGLATGEDPAFAAPRLALPPRVRVTPGVPSPLEPWIERAERRYGFGVRSAEAVRAW